jgi:hypothetical protein
LLEIQITLKEKEEKTASPLSCPSVPLAPVPLAHVSEGRDTSFRVKADTSFRGYEFQGKRARYEFQGKGGPPPEGGCPLRLQPPGTRVKPYNPITSRVKYNNAIGNNIII